MIESRGLSEDINTRTWLWLDVIGGHASETKKKKGGGQNRNRRTICYQQVSSGTVMGGRLGNSIRGI